MWHLLKKTPKGMRGSAPQKTLHRTRENCHVAFHCVLEHLRTRWDKDGFPVSDLRGYQTWGKLVLRSCILWMNKN